MAVNRRSSFTLIELLVVIAVIAVLLIVALPAVNSLSKSSGRKAAINTLLGAFDQARAQAIKDGQQAYVVFVTFTAASQTTLDRYNYRSYAIYEDDPENPAKPKQLTNWKLLPTGIAIRPASLATLADPTTLSPAPVFSFTPDQSSNTTPSFRCVQYNASGEVGQPAANVTLTIFEGSVNAGAQELVTSGKDGSGAPNTVESITIARLTGRPSRI